MGKKRWTTEEQRAWLEALIPAFVRAQQEKATGAFFEETYNAWHKKWPTPAVTECEVKAANGGAEKVLARKQKAEENVRLLRFPVRLYLLTMTPP